MAASSDFTHAKQIEVEGLKKRRIWSVVNKKDVDENANILGGRFVLTLKNLGTPNETPKVRFVAQSYNDREKTSMVHDASTLRFSSIRVVISVANILGVRLFSHDVTQAYLQSREKLSRKVYIQPKTEDLATFGLKDGDLLELQKPLYGLCDAGDYWGATIDEHLTNDLGMFPHVGDPSLYVRKRNGSMEGITGVYVDDSIHAGTQWFQNLTICMLKRLESKPRIYDNFTFFGSYVETRKSGELLLSQRGYTQNLRLNSMDISFETFRRQRAIFSWATHTRPDLVCYANRASQVTSSTFC